jgi:hypothetical protein
MYIINSLQSPSLYSGSKLTFILTNAWTTTAPFYFYGLTLPLSFAVPAKWVMLTIGTLISLGTIYFAGDEWMNWTDLLTASLVILVFLHTSVSPLEGNRRSFTVFFLVGALWFTDREILTGKLFFLALASGIYPPAGLLLLGFFSLVEFNNIRKLDFTQVIQTTIKFFVFLSVFLVVLMPYWVQILSTQTPDYATEMVSNLKYKFQTTTDLVKTFFVGERGALFRDEINGDFFLIFCFLLGLERLVLGDRFQLKSTLWILLVTSGILWCLAHLVHPMIYHPFKYTRGSLILVSLLPFARNLPQTTYKLYLQFSRSTNLRLILFSFSLCSLLIWTLLTYMPRQFIFLIKIPGFGLAWWKFFFGVPVVLTATFAFSGSYRKPLVRSFIVIFLIIVLTAFPHNPKTFEWRGMKLSNFEGMLKTLHETPPGTMVAGPPLYYMDPIPAFGHRNIYASSLYASSNKSSFQFICNRIKQFWAIYFRNDPGLITQFMRRNDINYLLVDRQLVKNKEPDGRKRCVRSLPIDSEPFLDRHFEEALWKYENRFYLIDIKTLENYVQIRSDFAES